MFSAGDDTIIITTHSHHHSLSPSFMSVFVYIFSRMMAMRPGAEENMMVEVNYRQGHDGTTLDTVVQDVYLCASMEFLLTVADIFLKATQHGFAQAPTTKSSSGAGDKKNMNSSVTSKESGELPKSVFI